MFNYEEKQTVEITIRPVCECGYVFNELSYNVRNKTFAPASCPSCMRHISNVSFTDFTKRTPNEEGDINLSEVHIPCGRSTALDDKRCSDGCKLITIGQRLEVNKMKKFLS